MINIVEDAILGNDLDGQFYSLLNVKSIDPVPANLVTSDDVRLTDAREPAPGSVVNASVAAAAAIDQSKLALNGQIPSAWLGTSPGTAARGDLAEYIANKNQPNGYAGLDSTGQIPSAMLPDSVGLATVNSVGLSMPTADFVVTNSPITTSGTISVQWKLLDGEAWFGALTAGVAPTFQYGAIPLALIPNLAAGQVTSGEFDPARLPLFIGVGPTHAIGCVPDPGDGSGGALGTDYLARDRTWKPAPIIAVGYQTNLPAPTLTVTDTPPGGPRTVIPGYDTTDPANDQFQDALFFYSTTAPGTSGFSEFPEVGYVGVALGATIWVYAAHTGFNNSVIVHDP